jgi:hypothetical protein
LTDVEVTAFATLFGVDEEIDALEVLVELVNSVLDTISGNAIELEGLSVYFGDKRPFDIPAQKFDCEK